MIDRECRYLLRVRYVERTTNSDVRLSANGEVRLVLPLVEKYYARYACECNGISPTKKSLFPSEPSLLFPFSFDGKARLTNVRGRYRDKEATRRL